MRCVEAGGVCGRLVSQMRGGRTCHIVQGAVAARQTAIRVQIVVDRTEGIGWGYVLRDAGEGAIYKDTHTHREMMHLCIYTLSLSTPLSPALSCSGYVIGFDIIYIYFLVELTRFTLFCTKFLSEWVSLAFCHLFGNCSVKWKMQFSPFQDNVIIYE